MDRTRLRPTLTLTDVTHDTPAVMPYESGVTSITPRHDRRHVMEVLRCTERTLQRYMAELRHRDCLTCREDANGRTLFSDEDVSFLQQYQVAKSARSRLGMADTQREHIAQLCAGVGRRQEAEAIRRVLRAQGEGLSVQRRVSLLLEAVPGLRTARTTQRLVWYSSTYHQTTDLIRLDADGFGSLSTVERAFRRVLAQQKDSPGL